MSKHTPGPWRVVHKTRVETADDRFTIASAGPTAFSPSYLSECEANAALIAAAPDLLDMLYRALPFIEEALTDPLYKPATITALLKQVHETLARAEGQGV